MRKLALILLTLGAAAVLLAVTRGGGPDAGTASSHREAPLTAEDPTADETDIYAFRSPDKPDTATVIANWIPGEDPAAGPLYYAFSPSARYDIYVDKTGDGKPEIAYYFRFKTAKPTAFLAYGEQEYTVTKAEGKRSTVVGSGLMTPIDNVGPKTLGGKSYRAIAAAGVYDLSDGAKVFAGQRDDAFFGDIGAIFDLVSIRNGTGATGGGKDFFAGYGVHAIALQLPISQLDNGGNHTIGVWAATDRQKVTVSLKTVSKGKKRHATLVKKTSWVQVSRLGVPLINELLIPTELKDKWNATNPDKDSQWAKYYDTPVLAHLLNVLYPQFGPFQETGRSDLVSVGLTGVKSLNETGTTQADMLRLNLSVAPSAAGKANRLGVLAGDVGGFPNGRRLEDDAIDILERAVGGALIGHSLPLGDGVDANDLPNLAFFPYEPDPFAGYDNTKGKDFPKTG